MSELQHVGCPACGSTLGVRQAQRIARCIHCNSSSVVTAPGFVPRFQVDASIDAKSAIEAVKGSLKNGRVTRGLAADAKFSPPALYFVPFYEIDAVQAGTLIETKTQRSSGPGLAQLEEMARSGVSQDALSDALLRARGGTHDTRIIFRDYQAQGCSQDLEDWGIAGLRPRAQRQKLQLRLQPWNPEALSRLGTPLPVPPIPDSAVEPSETATLRSSVVASGSKLLGVERRYVYYPVWRVEFRDRGHPYTMTVDAVSGQVLGGRAPEDRSAASLWLLVTLAFMGFFGGKTVSLLFAMRTEVERLELITVFLPLSALMFFFGLVPLMTFWRELRFRGEVVFGGDEVRVEKLIEQPESGVERAVLKIVNAAGEVGNWMFESFAKKH